MERSVHTKTEFNINADVMGIGKGEMLHKKKETKKRKRVHMRKCCEGSTLMSECLVPVVQTPATAVNSLI